MVEAEETFPTGTGALHPDWPEARINVSGLFVYDTLVLGFMKVVEHAFGCRAPLVAMHGAPAVAWNSGRVAFIRCTVDQYDSNIDAANRAGLGCFLTFTSHILEQADLADGPCNRLLDSVARRPDLNGVIVSSELLSRYIAGRYPDLRQVASIVKVAVEGGRGNPGYYQELGKRYWKYVVHPDDCFDLRLLDQLDREKAEVIINENCLRRCPIRPRHYELIARQHQALATAGEGSMAAIAAARNLEQGTTGCMSVPLSRQVGVRRRNCNMTRAEAKAVYDLGFRQFKLQGRRDHLFTFAYDLVRYTLEPEVAAPLVYKAMCTMIRIQ